MPTETAMTPATESLTRSMIRELRDDAGNAGDVLDALVDYINESKSYSSAQTLRHTIAAALAGGLDASSLLALAQLEIAADQQRPPLARRGLDQECFEELHAALDTQAAWQPTRIALVGDVTDNYGTVREMFDRPAQARGKLRYLGRGRLDIGLAWCSGGTKIGERVWIRGCRA